MARKSGIRQGVPESFFVLKKVWLRLITDTLGHLVEGGALSLSFSRDEHTQRQRLLIVLTLSCSPLYVVSGLSYVHGTSLYPIVQHLSRIAPR